MLRGSLTFTKYSGEESIQGGSFRVFPFHIGNTIDFTLGRIKVAAMEGQTVKIKPIVDSQTTANDAKVYSDGSVLLGPKIRLGIYR